MPRDFAEIGTVETLDRQERANRGATPSTPTPAPANNEIGLPVTGVRRKRANTAATPTVIPPASANTTEIGLAAASVQQERARDLATPTGGTPSPANTTNNEIGPVKKPTRRKRASTPSTPSRLTPASAPIGTGGNASVGGEGHRLPGTQRSDALAAPTLPRRRRAITGPTPNGNAPVVNSGEGRGDHGTHMLLALAATITELAGLQRRRVFSITQQSRAERAIESLIASTLGFRLDAEEKDRKKVFAAAKAFRLAVERGGEGHIDDDTHAASALSALAPLILAAASNRETWDTLRTAAEKEMRAQAKRLPVYDFAAGVKGFGDLALAAITAEAGIPIGDYRTVSGLWKRLGLAVIRGERQRKKTDKAAAAEHGYSPRRRAQVWSFCSDSMFRHQVAADKDEDGKDPKKSGNPVATPAHATGPYGEVYTKRRAHTLPRVEATADLATGDPAKWTPGRCHNDARRIMTKALLRDLWRVWRGMPPRGSNPES